jgi:hypothetical protein
MSIYIKLAAGIYVKEKSETLLIRIPPGTVQQKTCLAFAVYFSN